jgi:cbb3-type cytochrome oxidase subunit 3
VDWGLSLHVALHHLRYKNSQFISGMRTLLKVVIILVSIAVATWAYLQYRKFKRKYFDESKEVDVEDINVVFHDDGTEEYRPSWSDDHEYDHDHDHDRVHAASDNKKDRDTHVASAEMVEIRY